MLKETNCRVYWDHLELEHLILCFRDLSMKLGVASSHDYTIHVPFSGNQTQNMIGME